LFKYRLRFRYFAQMTVLILEDEYPAAERLQRLLRQAAPEAEVLAVLDSVTGPWPGWRPTPPPTLF
jgi:two-component system LytT family response regulator